MTRIPRPARRLAAAAAALAAVSVLSGCGGSGTLQAGAAAVVGETRIATSQLADQVREVNTANDLPADEPDAELTRTTLERLVTNELVAQTAQAEGVEISQGQIDAALKAYSDQLGGQSEVEAAFLQSSIPASAIDATVLLSLQVDGLGRALSPDGSVEEQQRAAFDAVVEQGKAEGVEVSPRFGTWVADELRIGPLPTDLAVPPAETATDGTIEVPVPEQS
ncbi:MAG: SurA N-terminal domain-containing protein [Candidatus Nanopelagicales bacterium]